MSEMIARQVLEALDVMAGIKMGTVQLALLAPMSGKIKSAIRGDDAEALAAYAAQSVSGELAKAGFDGVLTPKVLRELATPDGWALIMDVVDKRENAAAVLKAKVESLQGGSQFAGQARPGNGGSPEPRAHREPHRDVAREPQRERPHEPQRERPREQGREQAQQREPVRGASTPPARQASQPQSGPGRASEAPRPGGRTTMQPPPPTRTGSQHNVRTIGSAQRADRSADPNGSRTYDQVKVHGGRAALTIQADVTKRDQPTIRIEAARKVGTTQAEGYDWTNKIAIQLTTTELQHCTALFHGQISHLKFQNHGFEQDKWFEIEKQSGQYAGTFKVAIGQGKDVMLVQITSADIGDVSSLFRRQCAAQMRESLASLESALRPVSDAYNAVQARRGGGGGQQGQQSGERRRA